LLVRPGKTFESKDALEVVGVAQDVRFANPREPSGFVLYVPLTQDPAPVTAVVVRTGSDPARMASAVRGAFREVDPTPLVGVIQPLGAIVEGQLSNEKLLALLSTCFGVLALALTAVGVYGVIETGFRGFGRRLPGVLRFLFTGRPSNRKPWLPQQRFFRICEVVIAGAIRWAGCSGLIGRSSRDRTDPQRLQSGELFLAVRQLYPTPLGASMSPASKEAGRAPNHPCLPRQDK
jgi:hypothetical protein